MLDSSLSEAAAPSQIGPYAIREVLHPDHTYLADAPGGRRVVLKILEPDCLLRNQLHPNIKQRLARIRELACPQAANLWSVERDPDAGPFLVWEYVPGQPWDEHLASLPQGDRARRARELILTVESLHAQGLVHGALHARNIIVTPDGQIRLTHISPLLYHDPSADVQALLALLRETAGGNWPANPDITLRHLATHQLGADSSDSAHAAHDRRDDRNLRWGSILAALLAAAVGIGVMLAIARAVRQPATPPTEGRP